MRNYRFLLLDIGTVIDDLMGLTEITALQPILLQEFPRPPSCALGFVSKSLQSRKPPEEAWNKRPLHRPIVRTTIHLPVPQRQRGRPAVRRD